MSLKLKARVPNLDMYPEEDRQVLAKYYKQKGDAGDFILQGEVASDDINNLQRAKDQANADKNAAQAKAVELEAKVTELTEQLAKAPKANETVEAAVKAATKTLEDKITALETAAGKERELRERAQNELSTKEWETELVSAAKEAGVAEHGIIDAVNRARPFWRQREGGGREPFDPKDNAVIYSDDEPGKPMSLVEFMKSRVVKTAPHLVKPSGGGGSANNGGPTGGNAGQFVLTETQAHDVALWRRTKEAAAKVNQEVTIVKDPPAA